MFFILVAHIAKSICHTTYCCLADKHYILYVVQGIYYKAMHVWLV